MKYQDIEVALDVPGEPGLADNGDLESDLIALLEQVARAAQSAQTAAVLFLDEMQYLRERETEFRALITALHYCAQRELPLTLIGAGLPSYELLPVRQSPMRSDCLHSLLSARFRKRMQEMRL